MPSVTWTNFSMRPVHPTQGQNPVTRVLNMVKRSDGSIQTRRAIGSGASASGVLSHIDCEIDGTPYLFYKTNAGTIGYTTGASTGTLTTSGDADDPPLNGGSIAAGEPGAFAFYNGEVYYCDTQTILSWINPTDGVRRPGVVSMDGLVYYGDELTALGIWMPDDFDGPGYYYPNPDGTGGWPGLEGSPILPEKAEPFVRWGFTADDDHKGEKTLNTGFALAWYDPKRRIFGKRSEVFALPYIFGPPSGSGGTLILSDERAQYTKFIQTPDVHPAHEDYRVAVWFTPGYNILTNKDSTTWDLENGWIEFWNQHAPAMSQRMTQALFLEGIFDPGINGSGAVGWPATKDLRVACRKDNAALFESGRYIDTYDRPLPARFMAILPNGVAVYFYPWIAEDDETLGNYAEYSVKHPEQIGRNTDQQRQTISHLSNLRGDPRFVASDGRAQILVTRQEIYQIGFNGGVVLTPVAQGRGLRGKNFATSTAGLLWYCDEGVVLMRGGQMTLIDKRLGFGDWFDDLSNDDRADVVVGAADGLNQIMAIVDDPESAGKRAMVYDYALEFACEFQDSAINSTSYAAHLRTADRGSQLFLFSGSAYPDHTGSLFSGSQEVVCWLNDDRETIKQLRNLTIDLQERSAAADLTITVTAFRSGDPDSASDIDSERTHTLTDDTNGRRVIPAFHGMRGKLFRVKLNVSSGNWRLSRLQLHYEGDQGGNARSY